MGYSQMPRNVDVASLFHLTSRTREQILAFIFSVVHKQSEVQRNTPNVTGFSLTSQK